jgi:hypothetical protein
MTLRATHLVVLVLVQASGGCGRVRADAAPAALRPAGAVEVSVTMASRLDGTIGSAAPDLWLGLSDRLTLGITTSDRSRDGFGASRGLCVAGCLPADDLFRGLDVAARFPLVYGARRVTGEVATDIATWSPARAAVRVAAIAERDGARFYARARSELAIGLLGRADGNSDRLAARFTVGAQGSGPLALEVTVGAAGPATDGFFADLAAPAGLWLALRPGGRWSAAAGLGTDDLLGGRARQGFAALSVEVRVAS